MHLPWCIVGIQRQFADLASSLFTLWDQGIYGAHSVKLGGPAETSPWHHTWLSDGAPD